MVVLVLMSGVLGASITHFVWMASPQPPQPPVVAAPPQIHPCQDALVVLSSTPVIRCDHRARMQLSPAGVVLCLCVRPDYDIDGGAP